MDLASAKLRVSRQLQRTRDRKGLVVTQLKNGKMRRTIRVGGAAVEALRVHRAQQAKEKLKAGSLYEDRGLIFATHGGMPLNASNVANRSLKPLLTRAGLPPSASTTSGTPARRCCSRPRCRRRWSKNGSGREHRHDDGRVLPLHARPSGERRGGIGGRLRIMLRSFPVTPSRMRESAKRNRTIRDELDAGWTNTCGAELGHPS